MKIQASIGGSTVAVGAAIQVWVYFFAEKVGYGWIIGTRIGGITTLGVVLYAVGALLVLLGAWVLFTDKE